MIETYTYDEQGNHIKAFDEDNTTAVAKRVNVEEYMKMRYSTFCII